MADGGQPHPALEGKASVTSLQTAALVLCKTLSARIIGAQMLMCHSGESRVTFELVYTMKRGEKKEAGNQSKS